MIFDKKLPEIADLCKMADSVEKYPASIEDIVTASKKAGLHEDHVAFLQLFPEVKNIDEFESREDFYTRAATLAMIICEERESPEEGILSLQD